MLFLLERESVVTTSSDKVNFNFGILYEFNGGSDSYRKLILLAYVCTA